MVADTVRDEELIARYRVAPKSAEAGQAINELFSRYCSRVALWCLRFTGDRASASDLAQDIFTRAYENLNSFRGNSSFSTWLYTVTRNHCLNEMRSRATSPECSGGMLLDDLADQRQVDAQTKLERKSRAEAVRMLIQESLDETERKVVVLHYLHEFTLDRVTRMLGLTNSSGAKAYIVSAKRKLDGAVRQLRAVEARKRT